MISHTMRHASNGYLIQVSNLLVPIALMGTLALAFTSGCAATIPKEALALEETSLERRQLQIRRFDTTDEKKILIASAGLLQDLGFTIDTSETSLGLVVGSKDRDATEPGQVAGAIAYAILTGAVLPIDKNQKILASIVARPTQGQTAVRVTFQRIVWNTSGQITRLEPLDEPEMYQEFFSKLSKAVFLEAHEI